MSILMWTYRKQRGSQVQHLSIPVHTLLACASAGYFSHSQLGLQPDCIINSQLPALVTARPVTACWDAAGLRFDRQLGLLVAAGPFAARWGRSRIGL
eukprot:364324-Chlamydomonas_euryale.AAC.3